MTFDKLKYNLTYDEQNTVQFKMKLNKIHDKDILDKLESVGNKQGYIKQLIRADLNREEGNEDTSHTQRNR